MSAENRQDHPALDGLPIDWDATGDANSIRAKFEALRSEVQEKIVSWGPQKFDPKDAATIDIVMPAVRACVVATEPETPAAARVRMNATRQLAVWWYKQRGSVETARMLSPANIEHFAMFEVDGSMAVRSALRSYLRCVGKAAIPHVWPLPPPQVGFRDAVPPYSAADEEMFCRAAMLPGRLNRAGRLWVVVASFGAGLLGKEASRARPHDLAERHDGRIVVTATGSDSKTRIVPIRRAYTELARDAIAASDGVSFFRGTSINSAVSIAERLPEDPLVYNNSETLSWRRARNTWLVAHLIANTPLAALRIVAGTLAPKTLESLIRHMQSEISIDDAVEQAMGA